MSLLHARYALPCSPQTDFVLRLVQHPRLRTHNPPFSLPMCNAEITGEGMLPSTCLLLIHVHQPAR